MQNHFRTDVEIRISVVDALVALEDARTFDVVTFSVEIADEITFGNVGICFVIIYNKNKLYTIYRKYCYYSNICTFRTELLARASVNIYIFN